MGRWEWIDDQDGQRPPWSWWAAAIWVLAALGLGRVTGWW